MLIELFLMTKMHRFKRRVFSILITERQNWHFLFYSAKRLHFALKVVKNHCDLRV